MATLKQWVGSASAATLVLWSATARSDCGDGVFEAESEVCDDGNILDGDGCDAACELECEEVGYRATEHTCLHGSWGPFASVGATPGSEAAVPSSVSTPHTYYTVSLPGDPGDNLSRVTYQPGASDTVSVYLKEPYPMRLLDEFGGEVPVILENPVASCADADSLTWVRVYRPVEPGANYTLELGPSEEESMSMAFETMGYTAPHYLDRDHDGVGAGEIAAISWCTPPHGFAYETGDCDDEAPETFPGASELCDGINSDCDALVDDKEKTLCSHVEAGHICVQSDQAWRCGCAVDTDCADGLVCDSEHGCVTTPSPSHASGGASSEPDDQGTGDNARGGARSRPDNDDEEEMEGHEGGSDAGKELELSKDLESRRPQDDRGCVYSALPSAPGGLTQAMAGLVLLWTLQARRARVGSWTKLRKGSCALLALLVFSLPRLARAELPPGCEQLGEGLVEHSCFHAEFGPFEHRIPTPGAQPTVDTPNVNPVHTEYRLMLQAGKNTVTYLPERAGSFSIFTSWDVPLSVVGDEGALPELMRMDKTGCDALPWSRVYELSAQQTYSLTFDASELGEVVLVIEYVDEFSVKSGVDQDGDGYGDPATTVTTVCAPPAGYAPNTADCDDTNPLIHPAALEHCGDDLDENCNGLPDDTGLSCHLGTGACLVKGTFVCNARGQASCEANLIEGTKEQCNGRDDDCDGEIDEEHGLCPNLEAPRCVRSQLSAFCGCQFNSDCAVSDDYVCDAATGTCQKEQQEPEEGEGGMSNDGSGGQIDSSDSWGGRVHDDDDPDTKDDTSNEAPPTPSTRESGCGCKVHAPSPERGGSLAALLLAAGWCWRRYGRAVAHPRRHA